MKKLFLVLLSLALALILTGCQDDSASSSDTIKIGSIGPLEGDTSVYGIAVRNGADMAINDLNEEGVTVDGKTLELVDYDSKGDATEATNAYNKLVEQDGAMAIIGGTLSGESNAIASASQGIGTPILSPSATALDFTTIGDNIFRGCFTDPFQAKAMAEFTYETLGVTKVAILYETTDYSTGLMENFTARFEELGGEVLLAESYNTGDNDFNTQLTKIAAEDIEALYLPNYYSDDALIAKQAKALGIDVPLLGGDGWDGVLSVADLSDVEGAIFSNHYAPGAEGIDEFIARYTETYGVEPNSFAFLSYDCTRLLVQAMNEAETLDNEGIVAALYDIEYDGLLGHLTFDDNGDPIKDVAYVTIKDGQYVSYN